MAAMESIIMKDTAVPYISGASCERNIYEGIYNSHPAMTTPIENEAGKIINSFGKAFANLLCICTLLGLKRYGVKRLTKI